MKVSIDGTRLKESEKKKVYELHNIAHVTGHRGINFLNDYNEADEEK